MSYKQRSVKLVTVGDGGVGKTCLLLSYTDNKFPTEYVPTVYNCSVNVLMAGVVVSLHLWDVMSHEDYARIRPLSYPQADVFLICFSLVNQTNLKNALKLVGNSNSCDALWYPEVTRHCPKAKLVLLGTKLDLRSDPDTLARLKAKGDEPVTTGKGKEAAESIHALYCECSALTHQGLKEAFDTAMRAVDPNAIQQLATNRGKKGCIIL